MAIPNSKASLKEYVKRKLGAPVLDINVLSLIHMVEPNPTSKDRYSIAFNTVTHRMGTETDMPIDYHWNRFELDDPKLRG